MQFNIYQVACLSNFRHKGGSSFYWLSRSSDDQYINACGVIDNFDDTYQVTCYLPHYNASSNSGSYCMNLHGNLEYEHFDAYGIEIEAIQHSFNMELPIFSDYKLCVEKSQLKSIAEQDVLFPKGTTAPIIDNSPKIDIKRGYWNKPADQKDYRWISPVDSGVMTKGELDACRANQSLVFMGESHQRYTWTHLAYEYLDGQREMLSTAHKKHGDMHFLNFSFVNSFFFNNLAAELHKVSCSKASLPLGITAQSGSWDLGYTALRNVMLNPGLIPAFLSSLSAFNQKPCADQMSFVFVQTMPYPSCGENPYCRDNRKSKTNPAITAMAHYINRELLKVEQWNISLTIVDAMQVMKASRLTETLCSNHFLCRHGERQSFKVDKSEAGIALASEILHGLCLGWY